MTTKRIELTEEEANLLLSGLSWLESENNLNREEQAEVDELKMKLKKKFNIKDD